MECSKFCICRAIEIEVHNLHQTFELDLHYLLSRNHVTLYKQMVSASFRLSARFEEGSGNKWVCVWCPASK